MKHIPMEELVWFPETRQYRYRDGLLLNWKRIEGDRAVVTVQYSDGAVEVVSVPREVASRLPAKLTGNQRRKLSMANK